MNKDTASENKPPVTIDFNGLYPLRLIKTASGMQLELDLGASHSPNPKVNHFLSHMVDLCWLEAAGQSIYPVESRDEVMRTKKLHFPLPDTSHANQMYLKLHQQRVAAIEVNNNQLSVMPEHDLSRLIVGETRALGLDLRRDERMGGNELAKIPYDRAKRVGFDPKQHAPITDVHTHSSAQVSPEDLLKAAEEADLAGPEPVTYPAELLEKLGVPPAAGQHILQVQSFEFTPCKDEGMECEQGGATKCNAVRVSELTDIQRQAIINKMRVMPDRTMLFSDFDREMYRYRNPLVKHPALAKAIIKKIAEDYAAQGIEYAELSTSSMMDPKWFRQMVEAIDEIERDGVGPEHKHVKIRFLVGLPRNISPQDTLIKLEKIKYLARHPYITGIDLLGYESNKTSDFHWALAHIAQWAQASEGTELKLEDGWDFKRDFVIRVHAGETGKNPENVRDAIGIAKEYGVRVRVAHALTADFDVKVKNWLTELTVPNAHNSTYQDQFAFEMCPDSNQMYMTEPLVHDSPIVERAKHAPVFLGSDGSGAVMTTGTQLALSAMAAGVSLDKLAEMRKHEEGFVERQGAREATKRGAFEKLYGKSEKGLDTFLQGYQESMAKIPEKNKRQLLTHLPSEFDGKVPILIGGASGNSWKNVNQSDKHQIERAMDMLVHSFDPNKVYFVLGRVQKEGVSRALDVAVKRYNQEHPMNKFNVLGRYAGASNFPTGELAESITWVQDIPGGRDAVASSMVKFVQEHNGHALFFNGSDFTAEMIKGSGALHSDIPYGIIVPQQGQIAKVAKIAPREAQCPHVASQPGHAQEFLNQFVERILTPVGENHFFRTEAQKGILREGIDLKKAVDEVLTQSIQEIKRDDFSLRARRDGDVTSSSRPR